MQHDTALEISEKLASFTPPDRLKFIALTSPKSIYTTGFGKEGQLITHLISERKISIEIVTLQTGRLFPETLDLMAKTKSRYSIDIKEYYPDQSAVQEYKNQYGLDGFYESIEARQKCCEIRKVIPLAEALQGAGGWVTGLRRDQSDNRNQAPFCEWSSKYNLFKYNPLADLSDKALNKLIEQNNVPINELHSRGYTSIGCEPCTRATKPHEPPRAGRWWWEQEQSRECGLHVSK